MKNLFLSAFAILIAISCQVHAFAFEMRPVQCWLLDSAMRLRPNAYFIAEFPNQRSANDPSFTVANDVSISRFVGMGLPRLTGVDYAHLGSRHGDLAHLMSTHPAGREQCTTDCPDSYVLNGIEIEIDRDKGDSTYAVLRITSKFNVGREVPSLQSFRQRAESRRGPGSLQEKYIAFLRRNNYVGAIEYYAVQNNTVTHNGISLIQCQTSDTRTYVPYANH